MKLPLLVNPSFRIIAHRGASAYAPENTMAAFQLAVDMGVDEIELDVQLSSDKEVVVCHDLSLERYGHQGRVIAMNWAELSELDMGSWFSPFLFSGEKMVRLKDLFARFGPQIIYHVELKGESEELPELVCRLVGRYRLERRVVVTGFSLRALQALHCLNPGLRLGWLVPDIDQAVLDASAELGLFQICPRADTVASRLVRQAHAAAEEVRAWGLHGKREDIPPMIQHVIDTGCDGLTLDWPDWIKHR